MSGLHALDEMLQAPRAFFLAEQGTPGHIVEAAKTEQVFGDPVDPRTNDYVDGRFG